ncbi:hypothetical protein PAXRUDRAFT_349730 [Paxillus rubicundulus Ve08.2h10]|uniref:Uncharacterized protein n=1 Tax=Paxillus rubicundulus Ve08.2h10 TaxID=930991 RepID=A0A0D0DBJ2_9AGAM|nr:hypothetical protein PAXRUDRAFT_349730 [Paxillus rubicundulus Ve08.2h10]
MYSTGSHPFAIHTVILHHLLMNLEIFNGCPQDLYSTIPVSSEVLYLCRKFVCSSSLQVFIPSKSSRDQESGVFVLLRGLDDDSRNIEYHREASSTLITLSYHSISRGHSRFTNFHNAVPPCTAADWLSPNSSRLTLSKCNRPTFNFYVVSESGHHLERDVSVLYQGNADLTWA